MNYAEDRLDRKARGSDLWDDFCHALKNQDDGRLAATLRDVGWIRHAVFHYSRACKDETSVGDYAQMAEFSGYPEIGVLALLHYRNGGKLVTSDKQLQQATDDSSWLQQQAPKDGHCGCGIDECGQSLCELPPMMDLEPVMNEIELYVKSLSSRTMPTAHEVLTGLAKEWTKNRQSLTFSDDVPELLQFWKDDSSSRYRSLSSVLQLLLLKQLYTVLPPLAAEAVVQLNVDERQMAADFKSHNAYHVLIRAVVLGERIKPQRRKTMPDYHVPVWDILWGHDGRHRQRGQGKIPVEDYMTVFRQKVQACTQLKQDIPQLLVTSASKRRPLFVVGDSHVLSTAWQTIRLANGEYRTLTPVVVTGLKAWHCRPETRFFTQSLLQVMLKRLPADTTRILVSAGEIDCREGLGGPQLEGYSETSIYKDRVENTVLQFVTALSQLPFNVLVLPVCPHVHRSNRNGKAVGRAARRQVTQLWNEQLRRTLPLLNVAFLDYEKDLLDEGYVLKRAFNADGTHMNGAFLPWLEKALPEA